MSPSGNSTPPDADTVEARHDREAVGPEAILDAGPQVEVGDRERAEDAADDNLTRDVRDGRPATAGPWCDGPPERHDEVVDQRARRSVDTDGAADGLLELAVDEPTEADVARR